LDRVFVGESEKEVLKFIDSPNNNKNIIYGDKVDLNTIPFPARHLLPEDRIYLNNRIGGQLNNVISMISSRGCLDNCSFCAVPSKYSIRYRTAENFENEIVLLKKLYPKLSGIVLLDENFTISTEHVSEISKVLKKHHLPWECNSKANTLLNGDNIKMLAHNGCAETKIGLESGSAHLLSKMNKNIFLSQVEEILKKCKTMGLSIKLYLMHGFPGENMQTTNETIDFLERNKQNISRISLYRFSPLPGSAVFNSLNIKKRNWVDYTIYKNNLQWFVSEEDHDELNLAYTKLSDYLSQVF
jgi:radical SAM superfamily enzyme YgiQ (UPF0313 family)